MRNRFFWSSHPAQALLEAWLLGLAILFLLSRQVDIASPFVLSNGLLFLCGLCGLWAVLRIRLPAGGWLRQGLEELAVGFALSLVMLVGLWLPACSLGWEGVWLQSTLDNEGLVTFLLGLTGLGYVIARLGVRLWFFWNRLRRRRMLWAMTHAFLTLVVLLVCFSALGTFLFASFSEIASVSQLESSNLLAVVTERLLQTIFPGMALVLIMTALALVFLLPPSALFSYWIARKTTRRLETLADAARALRQGEYDARVAVQGKDEVAQLQTDFNVMAGDLEQTLHDLEVQRDAVAHLLQSRRDLIASVSHELRTPVATMRATLESALSGQDEVLSSPLRHDLEVVEGEVLRLQGLIDDLFTLSQAEAAGLALECRPTDVAPVLERMVDALRPLAWESGRVEVVAELPSDLPLACVDETCLEQVLANLLRNGIRHTPPGGIVAVAAVAQEEPEVLVIQVRDTGEGIAPDDLPHIWERFYRGEGGRARDGGGAGLGLALVKELTEAMGGSISVESAVGQSSCFTVRLPAIPG